MNYQAHGVYTVFASVIGFLFLLKPKKKRY